MQRLILVKEHSARQRPWKAQQGSPPSGRRAGTRFPPQVSSARSATPEPLNPRFHLPIPPTAAQCTSSIESHFRAAPKDDRNFSRLPDAETIPPLPEARRSSIALPSHRTGNRSFRGRPSAPAARPSATFSARRRPPGTASNVYQRFGEQQKDSGRTSTAWLSVPDPIPSRGK